MISNNKYQITINIIIIILVKRKNIKEYHNKILHINKINKLNNPKRLHFHIY